MRSIVNIRLSPNMYKAIHTHFSHIAISVNSLLVAGKYVSEDESKIYDLFYDKFRNKSDQWEYRNGSYYNYKLKISEAIFIHRHLDNVLDAKNDMNHIEILLFQVLWHIDKQIVKFYQKTIKQQNENSTRILET